MRNEQIVCDSCKKIWDVIQGGQRMHWERTVELTYKENDSTSTLDQARVFAEVCSECSIKAMRLLSVVRDFLTGEPLAHEAMTAILGVL